MGVNQFCRPKNLKRKLMKGSNKMLKKKRIMALLLTLCLLLALMSGCAKKQEPEVSSEPAVSAAPSEEAAPAESDPVEAPAEDAPVEDEAAPAEDEAAPEENYVYSLPLTTEDVTFSIYLNFPPYLGGFLSTYADQTAFIAWQERTGISLDFYESSDRDAMTTQIALMAASGDYYDMYFNLTQFYTGGLVKAIEDDFVLDIAELCEEFAPCYMSVVNSDDAHRKTVYDDDGHIGAFYGFNDVVFAQNGAIIRQDWLDDLGLETPETLSDWHDVLTAFKVNYDISDPLFLTASGQNQNNIVGCFGTAGLSNLYHEDGVVKSGLLDDELKEYLAMIRDWYNEGLINSDFYTRSEEIRDSGVEQAVLNGQCGIFYSPANTIVDYVSQNVDPNAVLVGLAEPTADDGTPNTFGSYPSYQGDNCISITTACTEPELCVQMLDYLFSDEGRLLCNYGLEGEAFEYDENGDPQWTDLIINNQEGIPVEQWCRVKYTLLDMPSVFHIERTWASYNEDQIDSQLNKWLFPYDNTLPSLSLTTEENEIYNLYITDISTYVEETIVRFIIGDMDLDTQWSEFTSTIESLHIQDCIDAYQSAFDRYNSR